MTNIDHVIKLQKYRPIPSKVNLGTVGSYGIERLILETDESWDGLTIKATFNPPDGISVTVLAVNGVVKVPHEAACVFDSPVSTGTVVFTGYENGVVKHSVNLLYDVDWHDNTDGENEGEITPTVLEQILAGENVRNNNEQSRILAEKNREHRTDEVIQNAVSVTNEIERKAASGEFDGKDGEDGMTPDIKIGTVETLPYGEAAYAEIVGPKESPELNLGIPSGGGATSGVTSVNGMTGDVTLDIPEKVSELQNDSNFVGKDYVDDSVAKNSAYYISKNGEPFDSVEELMAYSGELTNNDYAMVVTKDAKGISTYTQYKYNAVRKTWAKEFSFENGSFTAEQWAALSSGINAKLVSDFLGHIADKANPHNVTYQQLGGKKPTYTAEEVGALPKGTPIPPDLSGTVKEILDDVSNAVHADPDGSYDKSEAVEVVTAEEFDMAIGEIKKNLGGCRFGVTDGILWVEYDEENTNG